MAITSEQIDKICKNLTKLPNSNSNLEKDLNSILKYMTVLDEIDTTGVESTISVTQAKDFVSYKFREVSDFGDSGELLKCSNNKIIAGQIAIGNIM